MMRSDQARQGAATSRSQRLSLPGGRHPAAKRDDWGAAVVFLGPALLLLGLWFIYPIVESVILSFQHVDQFNFGQRSYVGLQNYNQLVNDPAFRHSLTITLIFVVFVVPAQTVLALVLASVLQSARAGRGVYRAAFFVPYMTSTVAVTTVFMQLFVSGGPLTSAAARIGVPNTTWYADVHLALPFLVIVYVYMFVGLYILTFVGGMQSIPAELYEAARVDGANALRRFLHITIPSLRPFVIFVVIVGMIQAIQIFDQAYVVSGGSTLGSPAGATSTLVVFMYQQAFRLNALGYGSAAAVVLLLIVFAGTLATRKLLPESVT